MRGEEQRLTCTAQYIASSYAFGYYMCHLAQSLQIS